MSPCLAPLLQGVPFIHVVKLKTLPALNYANSPGTSDFSSEEFWKMLLEPSMGVKWIVDPNRAALGMKLLNSLWELVSRGPRNAVLLLFSKHIHPIVLQNDEAEMFPGIKAVPREPRIRVFEPRPCPCVEQIVLNRLRILS